MRYINDIFTAQPGGILTNDDLRPHFEASVEGVGLGVDEQNTLLESVRYFLVGERSRFSVPNWLELDQFAGRARAFEEGADQAIDTIAAQIEESLAASDQTFDAIVSTSSTGNLMPGLSYRLAKKLGRRVPDSAMMIDLGNVGCTGSIKALNLIDRLDDSATNCLVLSVELPTTLINRNATDIDIWQGNCTFGDGAAALWVSTNPDQGPLALAVEELRYLQHAQKGLKLIHWDYSDYYTFRLANEQTFNKDVRRFITESLESIDPEKIQSPYWAIHPAGIALLIRLSRKLGLPRKALEASLTHYRTYSNMSSASILHILKDVADMAPVGAPINLLTMGAGFNVIYGTVRKER